MDQPYQPHVRTITTDKIVVDRPDFADLNYFDKWLNQQDNQVNVSQGWQCPLCKRVHAPHVDVCECGVDK